MPTLSDTLDVLSRYFPEPLVSQSARSRLKAVSESLPAGVSDLVYLECRLPEDKGEVDLILDVEPIHRAALLRHIERSTSRSPDEAAGWRRVSRLVECWAAGESHVAQRVTSVSLEFDLPDGDPKPEAPGIFVNTRFRYESKGAAEWLVAVHEALYLIRGRTPSLLESEAITDCFRGLPAGAFIPYIGFFPGRRSEAVRLCIAGLATGELDGYLRTIGWPGDRRQTQEIFAAASRTGRCTPAPRPGLLHLDVGDAVSTPLGLELHLDRTAQHGRTVLETDMLDWLVSEGLCGDTKRQALLHWPGTSSEQLPHRLVPERVARRINHIKLCVDGAGPVQAKAYLLAGILPSRRVRAVAACTAEPSARGPALQGPGGRRRPASVPSRWR